MSGNVKCLIIRVNRGCIGTLSLYVPHRSKVKRQLLRPSLFTKLSLNVTQTPLTKDNVEGDSVDPYESSGRLRNRGGIDLTDPLLRVLGSLKDCETPLRIRIVSYSLQGTEMSFA